MNNECRKISALISLYIDDALSSSLKMLVYNHLQNCKSCKEKYWKLRENEYLYNHISNFIKNCSPKLNTDFSKNIIEELQSEAKYKSENFARSVITMILAFFLAAGFFITDKVVRHNVSVASKNRLNVGKLHENFYRASLKNFLY